MIWTSDEAYRRGIDVMSEVVEQVPGDAWGRPSPCEGWRALDVLGHVGAATAMGLHILRGEAPDLGFGRQDPPGDAVRADPLLWWTGLAAPAREAVAEIDDLGLERVVDTPMGRRSVRDGLRFPAADLFLHAWDIAAATDALAPVVLNCQVTGIAAGSGKASSTLANCSDAAGASLNAWRDSAFAVIDIVADVPVGVFET